LSISEKGRRRKHENPFPALGANTSSIKPPTKKAHSLSVMKKLDKVLETEASIRVAKYRSDFEKTAAAVRTDALGSQAHSLGKYIRAAILVFLE
jgi:hypothetical protein